MTAAVREADACAVRTVGAYLRREGSTRRNSAWRRERDAVISTRKRKRVARRSAQNITIFSAVITCWNGESKASAQDRSTRAL